ncbi:MAG TPA: DUF6259 domain-containing protein [Thermoguttaceae bacterium]|nr:DUF6259 domain-containing protein [Thermoguttaceae bacterium]
MSRPISTKRILIGTILALLLAGSASSAVEAPVRLDTKTLEAQFSSGSLSSLVDGAGRVCVQPPKEPRGLGIHRVEATHYATAGAESPPPGSNQVLRRYRRFTDLEGATAECTLGIDEATGDVVLSQRCSSPAHGVWGVSWQIASIPLDYAVIVPGRSGVRLTATTPGREHQFDYPIGWEAQLVIVEGAEGGFYIWAEDVRGRFKRLIVERGDDGWRLTFITINFAPFDELVACESVAWHLNVYEGDWRVPARRYRDWADAHFRPTPIAEQQPVWVQDVRVMVIMGMDADVLRALATRLDPKQTILYVPAWRAAGYDRDYPTYDEPFEKLKPFVELAHGLGFRVMLHVNYFGVDPLNPLYEKFEPYQVRSPWGDHEKQWWLWTRAEPEIRFAYINPALKAWRDHFTAAMSKLCRDYAIDALHLDQTLCLYNDHNGLIEGMSMIEGNVALHRQLREALPGVALSGEGLNEITCRYEAFAQRHAWGISHTEGTWDRRSLALAHPISSYLFRPYTIINGYLGCAPPTSGQLYAAWNEAYEHWGVIPTLKPAIGQIAQPTGFSRQFFDEAAFWQKHRLEIDPEGPWPDDVAFPFRTADGRRAIHTTDGRFLCCGDRLISRTITGVGQVDGRGTIPGGVAFDEERLFGLDPDCWYPYFDEPRDPGVFHVSKLPDDLIAEAVISWGELAMVRTRSRTTTVVDLAAMIDHARCGSRPFEGEPLDVDGPLASPDGARFESQGDALFAHPPWKAAGGSGVAFASFAARLPADGQLRFVAQVAMDKGALGPDKTDGVTFGVTARAKGRELKRDLHNATDEPRMLELDLTALAGETVEIELTVHPGPERSPSFDWARWLRPRVERSVQGEGALAVRGPSRWAFALGSAGQLPLETSGDTQRVRASLPGTVLFLREQPAPVELPVDLIGKQAQVGFLGDAGLAIEPEPFVGVHPGRAAVGGVERDGLGAHPPNQGRTIAHLPMTLHRAPAVFRSWIGVRDGSQSTGVLFIVEVNGQELAQRRMLPGKWESIEVDLSRWAGQPVVLSLVTDSDGPFSFDWAHWGEPRIEAGGKKVEG